MAVHIRPSVGVQAKKKENGLVHHPGVEPGSRAWKAHILTVGLMVHGEDSFEVQINPRVCVLFPTFFRRRRAVGIKRPATTTCPI